MQALTAQQLLTVWESERDQLPTKRAIALLAAAFPAATTESLTELSIGERDARLMRLRECAFGPRVLALADCPSCGERLETTFVVDDIDADHVDRSADPLSVSVAGYEISFRLPSSLDLIAITNAADAQQVTETLLERCVLGASYAGTGVTATRLPEKVVNAISERMDSADPLANIQLSLSCPACGQGWFAGFDIVSFFWNEIGAWVKRVLHEVHIIASAYGWREEDILAMSPWRRQYYLEMLCS
jgi:hypothetical protein